MSEHHPISDLMTETMSKIKEMVDVNTIIGSPIVAADGTTVIPVSKVSFGFGAGGSEFASKHAASGSPLAFGGGSGAGVSITPVAFLVVSNGNVRTVQLVDGSANILGINAQASDTMDRLVEMIPGAINKVSNFVSGFKGKTEDAAEVAEPLSGDE